MLWVLLAGFLLAGGIGGVSGGMLTPESAKQLSERTEDVIADSTRSEAAQQTLTRLQKEVKAFEKMFLGSGKQLDKSYKDHADLGNPAQLILNELNSSWEVSQQRAIDLRFELRESMTKEEWTTLFARD